MPDTKLPLTVSEYGSVSRVKKSEKKFCLHDDMFSNISNEENNIQYYLGTEDISSILLSNPENNSSNKKSLKKLSSSHGSKRPRPDEHNGIVMTARTDDHDSKKIGYDHAKCVSDEKCRMGKQKHGQDSRRIDKKSFKASTARTKLDPLMSKSGFSNSDSALGGIDTIGINGLRSDLHDVMKNMEELSLNELLDGTFNYPNLYQEKGKKASSGNGNILSSVRKACSIIQLQGATESLQLHGSTENSKELSTNDSCQRVYSTSALYEPIEILERLALHQTPDIDSLISNCNSSNGFLLKKTPCGLPCFPWSFSHVVNSKTSVDSSKISLSRSLSQSKWVRIGSYSSPRSKNNCLSSPEVKTLNCIDDGNQRRIAELLQDIELMNESMLPQQASASHDDCKKFELLNEDTGTLNSHVDDSKDYLFHGRNETNLKESPTFDSAFKNNEVCQRDHTKKITGDCSKRFCNHSSRSSIGGCGQSIWPDTSTSGLCSELLAAAAILRGMSKVTSSTKVHNDAKNKSPLSQKIIKDRKSTSSLEKSKRLLLSATNQNAFKTKKIDTSYVNNVQSKSSKLLNLLNGDSMRPPGFVQSQIKFEKTYENQKFTKAAVKPSSAGYTVNHHIKDWSRRKNQRL